LFNGRPRGVPEGALRGWLATYLPRSIQLLRQGLLPPGWGRIGITSVAVAAVLVLWVLSGFFRVQPDEQGVELLFGRYVKTVEPGLNYWYPPPIGTVLRPKVTHINQVTVGLGANASTAPETLMLVGDQNVLDIQFVVQWRIDDAEAFLFNMRDPEGTVKVAAESALRELVGRNSLEAIMTAERSRIAQETRALLQAIMEGYGAGIVILDVRLLKADPPNAVVDAFNDVQRAKQDEARLRNEALAYRNDILPRARGDGARRIQAATAEKEKMIKEAEGEAARFTAFYQTYVADKEITARRLYLETMEEILGKANTIIIDQKGKGPGVVPYLALPGIQKKPRAEPSAP
jgi:modulator of FtsH protease HflK